MDSTSDDEFVVLELRNPSSISGELLQSEISISTLEIGNSNLPLILNSEIVKINANRNRLIQQSSYFRCLFGGSFSESSLNCVSIQWHLETVINILRFIDGYPLTYTSNNFLPILEGTLFFGVETLLLDLEAWFREITSQLVSFQNYARAILHKIFEKQLCEALLVWLESNGDSLECSSSNFGDFYNDILKKVRICLLPLDFIAGKRGNRYFSKVADERISTIFDLMKHPLLCQLNVFRDDEFDSFRVRLTKYSERIDLAGCAQITFAFLVSSLLPSSSNMDTRLEKKMKQYLIDLERLNGDRYLIPQESLPTQSFEAVCEIDISKCPRLDLNVFIKCIHMSFPSLRILKASHCVHFKMTTLSYLVQKCPWINEVDLTVDISPVLPLQVSIISASTEEYQDFYDASYKMFKEGSLLSNISKLTLEGRTEITDLDLLNISVLSGSLSYLNLEGCTSVTDVGISKLICKCMNLSSLLVSDTYFGRDSILALCSDSPFFIGFPGVHPDRKYSCTLAFRLQQLHIGGCKSIEQTSLLQLMCHTYLLKSLSLRDTPLVDNGLYNFLGSSLESLDVSETMVSVTALAHIIKQNPGLKVLKARGCRNFCHSESDFEKSKSNHKDLLHSGGSDGEELYDELCRTCILKEMEFGWGFSPFSLDKLRPSIRTLKALIVGLGASLGHHALTILPEICPLLETLVLNFQVISDNIMRNIMSSLKHLRVLGLCCCLGYLSSLSFQINVPSLRTLRLERVTPWMTNADLINLTRNCLNLHELSLSGCELLDSDSQQIISSGWPGLTSIHLEDCGRVTSEGVTSLLDCKAIEDLSLRHNGQGIPMNFIADAASKLPLLRTVALDLCDASEGGFESPDNAGRFFLSTVKIASCQSQRCAFELQNLGSGRRSMHKESIVVEWNSKEQRTTFVKERL
ncbi:ubiquitin-protein ligase isoform X2 [Tasmannia lanceolata]|uniref:ubiquitin-protein ligase isoform X2 n=1 Tax=Tasmannia lanceolata TaxID=3420 RepID=UPI00406297CA